jgi:hypothetical protein
MHGATVAIAMERQRSSATTFAGTGLRGLSWSQAPQERHCERTGNAFRLRIGIQPFRSKHVEDGFHIPSQRQGRWGNYDLSFLLVSALNELARSNPSDVMSELLPA